MVMQGHYWDIFSLPLRFVSVQDFWVRFRQASLNDFKIFSGLSHFRSRQSCTKEFGQVVSNYSELFVAPGKDRSSQVAVYPNVNVRDNNPNKEFSRFVSIH